MKGRFLQATSLAALADAALRAEAEGIDVAFVTTGPLGDAITLAAGLGALAPSVGLGIRTTLGTEPHRHPTVLARDMTALDLVCGGRALLAFTPPFGDAVGEAMALCRAMWHQGVAASEGPHYPVAGAVNRPRLRRDDGPRLALDLTDGTPADPVLLQAADLVLVTPAAPGAPAAPAPPALPPGVECCWIEPADPPWSAP